MRHGQLHHAQTVEFIGQPFPLVRRVARRQKEHALHLSAVQRGAGERDVAAMNGVKAAAINPISGMQLSSLRFFGA